jgi:hypothetical protein
MTEDLEIIPGNIHSYDRGFWNRNRLYTFLLQRILKSYQAIYILMTEDLEIIPGSIHSYDRGSWNHTRQYTFLFTGCRLCRRPPKLTEYIINQYFFDFLVSRDHANQVRIGFSSKLPEELRQNIEYRPQTESQTFWKIHFQHFCQKLNFYRGFTGNRLGQNDRNDRGIISDFYEKCDFDRRFAGQSHFFPERPDFHFLCLNKWLLLGRQICEAFICLEYWI